MTVVSKLIGWSAKSGSSITISVWRWFQVELRFHIGIKKNARFSEFNSHLEVCDSSQIIVVNHENALDIVWVSSHCGLEGNDEADKLAKAALARPLHEQLGVAVEFGDAKATIRSRTKKTAKDIEELPQETPKHWTIRKARVILNQLYTGFCAPLQPMRRILGLGKEKCRRCNEEETVSHFFTCAARARRRRAHFRDRTEWRRRILQKPLEILGYLLGEEEPHIKKGLFGLGRN